MSDLPPPDPSQPSSVPPPVVDYGQVSGPMENNPTARTWGMTAHVSALIVLVGVPSIVGPLIVWLVKKQEFEFVDDQGKEAVNFHLTALIVAVCLSPTLCIFIGFFIYPALVLAVLIFSVIGAIKANDGIRYRYPWTLRLIK